MIQKEKQMIRCNGCGREWPVENGVCRKEFVTIRKKWGYFSEKDTEIHTLRLCEDCYDRLVLQLAVPPEKIEDLELTYTQ